MLELLRVLPDAGVTPMLIVPDEGRLTEAARSLGIPVEVLPPGPVLRSAYGKTLVRRSRVQLGLLALKEWLPYLVRVRRCLRRHEAALLHVNDPRAALLAAPAARSTGLPVVAHLRGEFPFGARGLRLLELSATRLVAVSEAVRESLSPAARTRCVTVYNGVEVHMEPHGAVHPVARAAHEAGRVVVGCFASIVPFKGLHHLVRAMGLLNAAGLRERYEVLCVGEAVPEYGAYQRWLASLADELRVDNLRFVGWTDDPFAVYRGCDLTVLPSVSAERLELPEGPMEVRGNEGLPRTHLEAMAHGLPIVGTRIAGVPEQVVHGETGFVVPPSDPAALAEALGQLIRDEGLRRRQGAAGRERCRRLFSMEAYRDGIVRVYDALLPGRRPRGPEGA